MTNGEVVAVTDRIVLAVCEIPDRNSPDDQPEMMLVTPEELRAIVCAALVEVGGTTPGTELIADERKRQEAEEGWTAEHDDTEHRYGDLTQAAVSYAQNAICQIQHSDYPRPISWPWKVAWWKPSADPIRNLVKAGALIAAEIDRLLRKRTADSTVSEHSEIRSEN